MDLLLVTNNPKVASICKKSITLLLLKDDDMEDVLIKARDYIHCGYKLLTHPMAGSLKPNQTPYKSILLISKKDRTATDFKSLELIENSITAFEKFKRNYPTPYWSERLRNDFQTVDLSLIEHVLNKKMEVLYCET